MQRHSHEYIKPELGSNHCPFCVFCYWNLIVSFNQIQFCEYFVSLQTYGEIVNVRYLSGTIFVLRFRKFPQGRQAPVSVFGTICNGEEYGLREEHMLKLVLCNFTSVLAQSAR